MTGFPTVGFPDYARLPPAGGRHITDLVAALSGDPSTPMFNTTGFSSLTLIILNNLNTANFYIDVTFYDTNNPSTVLFDVLITPDQTNRNLVNVQVLSQWCTVQYLFLSGAGTEVVTTYIYGNVGVQPYNNRAAYGIPQAIGSNSINASTVLDVRLTGMSPGPAKVNIYANTSFTGFVVLGYWNPSSATWITFFQAPFTAFQNYGSIEVSLPPAPIQLAIANTFTSAQTVQYSVIPI